MGLEDRDAKAVCEVVADCLGALLSADDEEAGA